jgi:hypothetical protein
VHDCCMKSFAQCKHSMACCCLVLDSVSGVLVLCTCAWSCFCTEICSCILVDRLLSC